VVKRKTALSRAAFTMIELIFAIVVVSIAVISLPMMIQTTSRGIEQSLVQEAIFAASAELIGATSYYWDANSMANSTTSRLSRAIDLNGDCESDTLSQRHRLRPGHISQPYHRRCLDENATVIPAADGFSNIFPNLNNAEHTGILMFTDTTTDEKGYKESYYSDVNVTRTNEIKEIVITVKNSDGDAVVSLNTYSANLGEIDYYKRRF